VLRNSEILGVLRSFEYCWKFLRVFEDFSLPIPKFLQKNTDFNLPDIYKNCSVIDVYAPIAALIP
jgi:hypothetical protein